MYDSAVFFRHGFGTGLPSLSGEVYLGVYWQDSTKTVAEVAIGRNSTDGGTNLIATGYEFQYTTDDFTPVSCSDNMVAPKKPEQTCDDTPNLEANWCPIDFADAHNTDGLPRQYRRRYILSEPLTDVRAIRVLPRSNDPNASGLETIIDELEIGDEVGALGEPPSSDLQLRETGGPYTAPAAVDDVPSVDEGNLALGPNVVPFATNQAIAATLNDGQYGNAGGGGGAGYAGLYLGDTPVTIAEIAFGRDNTGVENDLAEQSYSIEFTTGTFDPTVIAEVGAATWVDVGARHEAGAHVGSGSAGIRRRYVLASPVAATAIRVVTTSPSVFDEIEVGKIEADLVSAFPPLTFLEEGGPFVTPAAPEDVPSFQDGNVALAPDAVPFSSTHDDRGHGPPFLNDGLYGDSNGFQTRRTVDPDPVTGLDYAGIYWTDGPKTVAEIAIGRDNVGNHTNSHFGSFVLQYTTEEFAFEAGGINEPGVAVVKWIGVGVLDAHLDDEDGDTPDGIHRYLYELDAPVQARAFRLVLQSSTHIDEIELFEGTAPMTETVCDDGIDNDTDGVTDCADTDCTDVAPCGDEVCDDSFDNDGDGDEDCDDTDCDGEAICQVGGMFKRGDANSDDAVNIADAIRIFGFLFQGGDVPLCLDTADTNDVDDGINLTDGIYLLAFLFQGGPAIPAPGTADCGVDPVGEGLISFGCDNYAPCGG